MAACFAGIAAVYAPDLGRFIYDSRGDSVVIDDRTLAHLRLAMMNKLRRSEPFMFDVEVGDGSGRRSFWIHPAVPLQFHFFEAGKRISTAPGWKR